MLRPERLGISSEPKAAVGTLNNWVRDCGKSAPGNDPPVQDPVAERLMPEAARASTKGDLYDRQDIEHVRDCWLFKQARASVARQSDSDAARAVALFDLANRMVALVSKSEPAIPQSLYDIAVVGKGSPEDRAWVFAELLRQTGIDAVILKPASHAAAAETPNVKASDVGKSTVGTSGTSSSGGGPRWLVGVIIDKQVYLFDPTLGWPIPAPADKGGTPAVQSAATLADVLADDGLLRKLDISPEMPYPLHAADLKSARVEIITSSRYWSPRIRRLESFMSGERSATIYVPLGDVGSRPGLLSRVTAAGSGLWKKEDVVVWDYPDRQTAAIEHFDQQGNDIHQFFWLPFQGPVTAEIDKDSMKLTISPGTRKQLKSRIAQLQGDDAGAVRNYLLVQLDELPPVFPLPEEMQAAIRAKQEKPPEGPIGVPVPKLAFATNFRSAEDAKYWMAVCQLEQNMLETASETFDAYLRRYAQGGKWIPEAAVFRGLTLAKTGRYGLAVQQINDLMRAFPEDDPRWATCKLFLARWRAARDASNAPANSHVENSPQQEQPAAKPESQAPVKGARPSPPPATTPAPAKSAPAGTPPAATNPTSKTSPPAANSKTTTP
jgi:hypothetical protein